MHVEGAGNTTFQFSYEETSKPKLMRITKDKCITSCLDRTIIFVQYVQEHDAIQVFFGNASAVGLDVVQHPDWDHVMISLQIPQSQAPAPGGDSQVFTDHAICRCQAQ